MGIDEAKDICRDIIFAIRDLPHDREEWLRRQFPKSWMLVQLYKEGLAIPTKSSINYLDNLYLAITKPYRRLDQ